MKMLPLIRTQMALPHSVYTISSCALLDLIHLHSIRKDIIRLTVTRGRAFHHNKERKKKQTMSQGRHRITMHQTTNINGINSSLGSNHIFRFFLLKNLQLIHAKIFRYQNCRPNGQQMSETSKMILIIHHQSVQKFRIAFKASEIWADSDSSYFQIFNSKFIRRKMKRFWHYQAQIE